MRLETAFSMDTSSIKYGAGVTREVGHDMSQWGARRVMVVTDPDLAASEPVSLVLEALRGSGIEAVLFDQVRVEPTDESIAGRHRLRHRGALRRLRRASAAARASTRPRRRTCTPPGPPSSSPTSTRRSARGVRSPGG